MEGRCVPGDWLQSGQSCEALHVSWIDKQDSKKSKNVSCTPPSPKPQLAALTSAHKPPDYKLAFVLSAEGSAADGFTKRSPNCVAQSASSATDGVPAAMESFFANHAASASGGDLSVLTQALAAEKPLDELLAAVRQLAAHGAAAAEAVPALIDMLNKDHQAARAAAVYALGAIGEAAVAPLIERLAEAGRRGWEENGPACWNENAVQMMDEAHALAAIGSPAVAPLIDLLETAGEWGRLNAAFALGEMDSHAGDAVPALARCLEDDSHRIVRIALAALGTIGGDASKIVPRMSRFLSESRPDWEEVAARRVTRMARDQVRVNAAAAMGRLGPRAIAAEICV